jgi:ZIP family zinc transporter
LHPELGTTLIIAALAAVAAPVGGLIGLWRKPSSLAMSLALGFASGVLPAAVAFEMLPKSLDVGSLWLTLAGFACGFLCLWGFDLFIHRGEMAGEGAEEKPQVARHHRRHGIRGEGDKAPVIAGGTLAEEVIEGLGIGVGAAFDPGIGIVVATAIVVDNFAVALSLGEITRENPQVRGRAELLRVLRWTGLLGVTLFLATLAGFFLLGRLPLPVLGFAFAAGAGVMFYQTVTDLVPEAESRHYRRSAGLAAAAGFLSLLVLGEIV